MAVCVGRTDKDCELRIATFDDVEEIDILPINFAF
jgi:hypothetical protein